MSTLIAIDPNLLLGVTQRNRHCQWLLEGLLENAAEFCVALDWDRFIYEAYEEIQEDLKANDLTKTFIEKFLLVRTRRQRVRNTMLDRSLWAELADNFGVKEPVEPELITVGISAGHGSAVLITGEGISCKGAKERATDSPTVIDGLHRRFGNLCIWRANEAREALTTMQRARYPGDESQLRDYVVGCEDEFIEYKQPATGDDANRRYSTGLSQSIIIDALKAASGMINNTGGTVFVGITPEKGILGVDTPSNTSTGEPDDDALSRRFTDQFNRFEPPVNQFVKPSVIPLQSGRSVVALHVEKGHDNTRYTFRDNKTISVYDRCGPSTRCTQVLQRL